VWARGDLRDLGPDLLCRIRSRPIVALTATDGGELASGLADSLLDDAPVAERQSGGRAAVAVSRGTPLGVRLFEAPELILDPIVLVTRNWAGDRAVFHLLARRASLGRRTVLACAYRWSVEVACACLDPELVASVLLAPREW
jgi:hypothetical protein